MQIIFVNNKHYLYEKIQKKTGKFFLCGCASSFLCHKVYGKNRVQLIKNVFLIHFFKVKFFKKNGIKARFFKPQRCSPETLYSKF